MRSTVQHAGCVAVLLCSFSTHAAQEGPPELVKTPILWKGVEVVTNDFDSVERIRQVAALATETLLLISDPKLKAVCDAVRKEAPASRVECSPVIGATPGGPPHGWYVIEMDLKERRPLACVSVSTLGADLQNLVDEWQQALVKQMLEGVAPVERVNDQKYLDYANADLSALAARLHMATKDRARELASAAMSCEPKERTTSFYLVNFVGDPERFIPAAGYRINDQDSGAANAATRFLIVFADFVSPRGVQTLAKEACQSVLEGGFTARNKSLSLLNAWRKKGALSFSQLGAECQQQVRDIARTSIAEQIAVPARELAGLDARAEAR